jgi:hypothetical protein
MSVEGAGCLVDSKHHLGRDKAIIRAGLSEESVVAPGIF